MRITNILSSTSEHFLKKFFVPALLCGMAFPAAAYADDIPVERVILSTSGLAQFEHRAQVTGDAAVEFPVRLDQVDDILKSLVIFDVHGRLGSVTLPGKQPLDQIFKDLPFNRHQLGNMVTLLNAYQGATVTLKSADLTATGKIIQAVPETVSLDEGKTVTRHRLSLMTDVGLKSTLIEDLQSLQFDDKKIQAEIDRALEAVRENSTAGRRTLSVNLLGKEARDVTLSYVVPAPLWKTAYRMVVPAAEKDKGLLQGWAIIENMTAGDWKNVDLSLVSGNPVTFHQALYPSYYVTRPDVPVQVFGMTPPRVDQGTVGTATAMQSAAPDQFENELRAFNARTARGSVPNSGGLAVPMMPSQPNPGVIEEWKRVADQGRMKAAKEATEEESYTSINQISDIANAAMSAEAATQVLFRFPDKYNLQAGQSMMLPFVSRDVPMQRVSLYQPDTNAKHPLAAVEISNDGDSSLPPGVLTLYEESALLKGTSFIGDAQIPVLNKGEKRLVSYALDNKTTIDRADKSASTEGRISVAKGLLNTLVKNRLETVYTIKAPAEESRTVIVEHPRLGADYKVVEPDPKDVEVTDNYYRLRIPVKAGETKQVKLVLESELWQSMGIMDMPVEQLLVYAGRNSLSEEAKKSFAEIARVRKELDDIDRKIAALDGRKENIFRDQERVRENLRSLDEKSAVQQKYLDKLNEQEDVVTKLDADRQVLAGERQSKAAELANKIAELSF